jgi:hypothetical protein
MGPARYGIAVLAEGSGNRPCGHCAFRIGGFRQSAGSHGRNKDVNLQGY